MLGTYRCADSLETVDDGRARGRRLQSPDLLSLTAAQILSERWMMAERLGCGSRLTAAQIRSKRWMTEGPPPSPESSRASLSIYIYIFIYIYLSNQSINQLNHIIYLSN